MLATLTNARLDKDLLDSARAIRQRHKTILSLHRLSVANNHVWGTPESSAKYDFLFEHVKLKTMIDVSALKVRSSIIVKEIHKHPAEFARVVAGSYNQPSFNVLINHTVPAAFGFFSSSEMLDAASEFYCHVVDCCSDVRIMRRIVTPLLVSLATFRFCEAVFDVCFRKLSGSQKDNETVLADCVVEYLCLLPEQVLRLLRKIVENMRTSFYFGQILFPCFLQQCAELWLPSCPYFQNVEAMQKVMNGIAKNTKCMNRVKQAIYMVRSRYRIPSLISFPDRPVMKLQLSMADLRNLAVLLSVMKQFPEELNMAEFTKIPKTWEPCLISISIYFQSELVPSVKRKGSLFGDAVQDVLDETMFERFAEARLLIKEMDNYTEMGDTYKELVIGRLLAKAIEQTAEKPLEYIIGKTETMPRLRRKLLLASLTRKQIQEKWKRVMGLVDKEWTKLVSKMSKENTKRIAPKLGSNCKSVLNRVIRDLSCIDKAFLSDRLNILLSVFGTVEVMKTVEHLTDSLYLCVFENALCKKLLSSVLQINAFGMWDKRFASQCSESESRVWLQLESSILSTLSQDRDTLDLYTRSQERLGIESHMTVT